MRWRRREHPPVMTPRRYVLILLRNALMVLIAWMLGGTRARAGGELQHTEDRAAVDEWGHADLGTETTALQVLMEQHRANPDNQTIAEDLAKAKTRVEVLWLKRHP